MKTNKEFIDGIYAKADLLMADKTKPVSGKIRIFRIAAPVAMAACALIIILGITINSRHITPQENQDYKTGMARFDNEETEYGEIYSIKGKITSVLEASDGYGLMKVCMTDDSSYMPGVTLDITYSLEQQYTAGEDISVNVQRIMLNDGDCFLIVQ